MKEPAADTLFRRTGLILAAGRGRRMGRTKQLVPWLTAVGEKPLAAAAFDSICGVCDRMIVVLGHEADAVAAALAPRPFLRVESDPDGPMFESVRAGLLAAQAIDPLATVVLQPGDHPAVAPAILVALAAESTARPARAVMPEFRGRGGHPVFLPPGVVREVLRRGCPAGLGQFWIARPDLCRRLPVSDESVILNVDTPDQLLP
jgi:CTP:molybdopterin cytidylyltransferase MocA